MIADIMSSCHTREWNNTLHELCVVTHALTVYSTRNNCVNNSQVIAWGDDQEAESNFPCCIYNYSLIALNCMWLFSNHINSNT